MSTMGRTGLLLVAGAALAAVACSTNNNTSSPADSGLDSTVDGATSDAGLDAADAALDGGEAGASLTDEQIVGILLAVNEGEIAEAQLAMTNTTNFAVQEFATRMVFDHTTSNQLLAALEADGGLADAGTDDGGPIANDAGVVATTSAIEQQLVATNQQELTTLTPLMGDAFDLAYANDAVTDHQTVLNLIDTQLTPNAHSPALQSLLVTFRQVIAAHLALSQALVAELGDAGNGDAGIDNVDIDASVLFEAGTTGM
jgi:putative membrane protein